MLLRTSNTILYIRIILVFFIPLCYCFLGWLTPGLVNKRQRDLNIYNSNDHNGPRDFHGRQLLSLGSIPTLIGNCTPAAILEFPFDGFTKEQRQNGWVSVHCLLAIYCFVLLANVCEQYFVPAIKIICNTLDMTEDVAGATFMAAASSSPELFINCVGTFVTKGDLGVGTVVGSAVFNVLAVPACCGFFVRQVVELDWWPVSRDCMMYAVAVISLILTLQDNKVDWYEALALVLAYTFYILAMYFNKSLGIFCKSGCCRKRSKTYTEITPLLPNNQTNNNFKQNGYTKQSSIIKEETIELKRKNMIIEEPESIWSRPSGELRTIFLWLISWPLSVILWLTIPDCRKHNRLVPLTFFMCILWIGGTAYLVAWLITIIGDTFDVPDSVMGLTFLAAGTSVPEAVSSIIVTNQGHGAMGISNSIGSNTFDILLCLGLPWLIKSLALPQSPGDYSVTINSTGLSYSALSLLSTLLGLYISLALNKFVLDWKIGATCILMYVCFLALATLIEMNIFFPVNLPTCDH